MAEKELVFGIHAVEHIVSSTPEKILGAYLLQPPHSSRVSALLEKIRVCGCHIEYCSKQQLNKMAQGGRHQGVMVEMRGNLAKNERWLAQMLDRTPISTLCLLVLDGVQDPRNLGACLRVADGVGAQAVIVPKNRAAGLTLTARKVASGATVPVVQVTNLARTLRALKDKGIWLVGTSDDATEDVFSVNLTGPLALIVGNEEKGLRRLTRETCDVLVSIPMVGVVNSLNVSVAAGIAVYEALRQRRGSPGQR